MQTPYHNSGILLMGFSDHGKSTVAKHLVDKYGYTEVALAGTLKDVVSSAFGVSRDLLEGDTKESREWREQDNSFWSSELGVPISPRIMLEKVGTELFRNIIDDNFWIMSIKQRVMQLIQQGKKVVISDCRFGNERLTFGDLGFAEWEIRRSNLIPEWVQRVGITPRDNGYSINSGHQYKIDMRLVYSNGRALCSITNINSLDNVHKSRYSWIASSPHKVILNDKDVTWLHKLIDFELSQIVK